MIAKINGMQRCSKCRERVPSETIVARRCKACQPLKQWPECQKCGRRCKPCSDSAGRCRWCNPITKVTKCNTCHKPFEKLKNAVTLQCPDCFEQRKLREASMVSGSRRCADCGYKIVTESCLICDSLRYRNEHQSRLKKSNVAFS